MGGNSINSVKDINASGAVNSGTQAVAGATTLTGPLAANNTLAVAEGVNVNQVNLYGKNALFFCHYDKTKLLIDAGINVNQVNDNNENALFSPLTMTHKICSLLIASKMLSEG